MNSHNFNHFDHTLIIGFWENFKQVCDTNDVHDGTAMWLFHFFIDRIPSAVLNAHLGAESTDEE